MLLHLGWFITFRPSTFVTHSRPTNVVSGTGTRDEPLRTTACEARVFTVALPVSDYRFLLIG